MAKLNTHQLQQASQSLTEYELKLMHEQNEVNSSQQNQYEEALGHIRNTREKLRTKRSL
jgi:hypothetical protein